MKIYIKWKKMWGYVAQSGGLCVTLKARIFYR